MVSLPPKVSLCDLAGICNGFEAIASIHVRLSQDLQWNCNGFGATKSMHKIDYFACCFCSGVQPSKLFLNPVKTCSVSVNPTSKFFIKFQLGAMGTIG